MNIKKSYYITIALYTSFILSACGIINVKPVTTPPMSEIHIVQGSTIGESFFPIGDTSKGGSGQPVDGVKLAKGKLVYHIHVHLSLYVNGKQISIPLGIGIIPPAIISNGVVDDGHGAYWIHTHDATGIIHVESPIKKDFTLKNFFDIWGETLEKGNIASFKGETHIFINGKPFNGDLSSIVLESHEQIVIEVGNPVVKPQTYVFPPGF